jgi:NTE family protein
MKALVLSGGGAKGAYQIGVLRHLLSDLQIHYDILTGVSVGALNATFLAQYSKGQEQQAYTNLRELWLDIDDSKIYKNWYFGLLWKLPLLWKPSVYNSKPLWNLVRKNVDTVKIKNSGKHLRVGAISLDTGNYRTWSEKDPDIREGTIASSAFPGMLTPIRIDGQTWTDGGAREITPVHDAINLGATSIHAVNCSPTGLKQVAATELKTLSIAKRVIDIMSDEIDLWDFKVTELHNRLPSKGKRVVDLKVVRPTTPLLHDSLDFDPKKIRRNIEQGYVDAQRLSWT